MTKLIFKTEEDLMDYIKVIRRLNLEIRLNSLIGEFDEPELILAEHAFHAEIIKKIPAGNG